MARRVDGEFGEGIVLDTLPDGSHLVVWSEEDAAAKLEGSELMPFGSSMGLSTERRPTRRGTGTGVSRGVDVVPRGSS